MSLLNNINCQHCEKFITKEQWNSVLDFSRPLHRKADGYWPAYFPEKESG